MVEGRRIGQHGSKVSHDKRLVSKERGQYEQRLIDQTVYQHKVNEARVKLTVHGLCNLTVCDRALARPVKVSALTYLASFPLKADMICEFAEIKLGWARRASRY